MKQLSLLFVFLCIVGGFSACMRDDDEPAVIRRDISRLYVSTSDYNGNSGNNFHNVFVLDPADSSVFPPANRDSIYQFTSAAKGGSFINFSPFSGGLLFQGSQNSPVYVDTAVQIMNVSNTGVLRNIGRLGTRKFNDVRGLAYTIVNEGNLSDDYLLVLNTDTMFVVDRPTSKGSSSLVKARYHMPLNYNPWGINISNRDVFVSSYANEERPEAINGVVVYKDLTSKFVSNSPDSLLSGYARFDLTISDVENVRGLSYSKEKDLLVVTDFSGAGNNSVGRILFFEKFSQYTSSQTIVPNRVIKSSLLKQPLDVAIDTRSTGRFIYVADPIAKRVFRFNITDDGVNVEPNAQIDLFGRTPVSVSLDARSAEDFNL